MSLGLNELQELTQKDGWRDVLIDLVMTSKIDPWDIDMEVVSSEFMKYIRKMSDLDLVVPANIILASAIILKYKANTLNSLFGTGENEPEFDYVDDSLEIPEIEDIPQLTMVNRLPSKRKVTLTELISEIEKVIKYNERPERTKAHERHYVPITLNINEEDAEKRINEVYSKIERTVDSSGWTTFSRIVDRNGPHLIVSTLLGVLHLYQREKIMIRQEKIFEDIFIKLKRNENEKAKQKRNKKKVENGGKRRGG